MINRREFIKDCAVGAGVLAGGGLDNILAASRGIDGLSPEQVAAEEDFWFEVRQAFALDRNYINFNNGTIQNGLRIAQEAVQRYSDFTSSAAWQSMTVLNKEIEFSRRKLGEHLGCDPEELVICRGGSEAGQIAILGLDLHAGDEVVTTNQDYPRLVSTWRQRAKRDGIIVKFTPLPAPPVPLDKYYDMVTAQVTAKTKLIHVTHFTHWTGQMAPVRRLVDFARLRGIEVLVDGAHGFMHVPFKLADLGCDYYTASLHKWCMAPPGNGFLRIPKDRISKIWPLTPPWTDTPDNIRRFEDVGTRTPANRIAITEGIMFNEGIGLERKAARMRYLKDRWANRLKALPKVRFYTSLDPAESCAIATFGVEGLDMDKLTAHLLDKYGIIVSPIKHPDGLIDGIRIVTNVTLSVKEVDFFAEVMEKIVKAGALV